MPGEGEDWRKHGRGRWDTVTPAKEFEVLNDVWNLAVSFLKKKQRRCVICN